MWLNKQRSLHSCAVCRPHLGRHTLFKQKTTLPRPLSLYHTRRPFKHKRLNVLVLDCLVSLLHSGMLSPLCFLISEFYAYTMRKQMQSSLTDTYLLNPHHGKYRKPQHISYNDTGRQKKKGGLAKALLCHLFEHLHRSFVLFADSFLTLSYRWVFPIG